MQLHLLVTLLPGWPLRPTSKSSFDELIHSTTLMGLEFYVVGTCHIIIHYSKPGQVDLPCPYDVNISSLYLSLAMGMALKQMNTAMFEQAHQEQSFSQKWIM